MNPLEIAGVATGVLAVWLTTREHILCWPIGIVSVSLFILVFYQARLYGAMGLQVAYVMLALYGWHSWLRGGPGHGALRVSRTPGLAWPLLASAGLAAAGLLGGWLAFRTDAALPWTDATTTAVSLVAQFMQTRKWIENWLVWVVVDIAYVAMYLSQGLNVTAVLYGVFLGLAVLGWKQWAASLVATPSSSS